MSAIEQGLRQALEKLQKDLSTTNTAHASDLKKAKLWAELLHERNKVNGNSRGGGQSVAKEAKS
jgi:hypothetical protein|tara:strand:+ start:160 stop:351 length:192 start_codon:yes stop_codon:yes gene_type:complete